MTDTLIDFAPIKARQRSAWSTGNYAVVGTTLQIVGENLCEALDLRAGARVLDVAAGNGNATLAAARRFAEVTSTDYVSALLEAGKNRAQAEGLRVNFREADAEDLPFAAASFDVVLSTFGVMFTADQVRAAQELMRVCKPGGKIGLANWTPNGFVGQMFKVISKYVPPAPGLKPPALWGTEERLSELFSDAASISVMRRSFNFRYRTPEHFLEVFRTYYGPMHRTFAALDMQPELQVALRQDMLDLIRKTNRSSSSGIVLPAEYLEVIITTSESSWN